MASRQRAYLKLEEEQEQQIRFCTTSDNVRIAYATVGRGPPLVKAANWLTHLQIDSESPVHSHWIRELSRYHQYIRYDERGCGLSDWQVSDFSFDAWVRDLETIIDSLRLDRFILLGISQGGPVSIAYTARHPEKVSHLILYGAYARGWKVAPPNLIEEYEALMKLTELGWGRNNPVFRQLFTSKFVPDAGIEQMRWFNELQKTSTSPENAVLFQKVFRDIDVLDLLPRISVPTLILHSREDDVVPFDAGRQLAALIPGARFVALEGRNHIILENEPAWAKFLYEVRRFVGVKEDSQQLTRKTAVTSWQTTTNVAIGSPEVELVCSLIANLTVVTLSRYRVVGNYVRYGEAIRNCLKDLKLKMVAAFQSATLKRENYLLWAPPGSGKTYFVQQIAASLKDTADYYELNLAALDEERFRLVLAKGNENNGPSLCFVDEVDSKPNASWPYETLLPCLDSAAKRATRQVFVVAGSSGTSLTEMKASIACRPKGADLLSRVPTEHEFTIPPMDAGDRVLLSLSQLREAGKEIGKEVKEVEKLALYYTAFSSRLTSPRQLREFSVRSIERMESGEDRVKYDNLFNAGDPENKAFWMQAQKVAGDFANSFVLVEE